MVPYLLLRIPIPGIPRLAAYIVTGIQQLGKGEVIILRYREKSRRFHFHRDTALAASQFDQIGGFSVYGVGGSGLACPEGDPHLPQGCGDGLDRPLVTRHLSGWFQIMIGDTFVSHRGGGDDDLSHPAVSFQGSGSAANEEPFTTHSVQLFKGHGRARRAAESHGNTEPGCAKGVFINRYVKDLRTKITDDRELVFRSKPFQFLPEKGDYTAFR